MTEPIPDPAQPADDADELDWDVEKHGRMAEAASDDEPATEPYEGDDT